MTRLLVLISLASVGLLFAVVLLIIGLFRKQRRLVLFATLFAVVATGTLTWAGFRFAKGSYRRVSGAFRARTGTEIYEALYGTPTTQCVRVLKHQDQLIPKIDYAIFLYVETCPQELRRVLTLHPFRKQPTLATTAWVPEKPNADAVWFAPDDFGDSVLVFTATDDVGNGTTIYAAADSSRAFIIDVLD